ncbi:hypothetical protein E2C01_017177 [Portunus trituberculatus]|uniref:Uncharacterized protein n=1 Tax=Portunus trituberculatus TaxID=210409 RepID=A0A5B7DSG9_PORTR|nr:hypothetical protein [Portunus trituberculatus]
MAERVGYYDLTFSRPTTARRRPWREHRDWLAQRPLSVQDSGVARQGTKTTPCTPSWMRCGDGYGSLEAASCSEQGKNEQQRLKLSYKGLSFPRRKSPITLTHEYWINASAASPANPGTRDGATLHLGKYFTLDCGRSYAEICSGSLTSGHKSTAVVADSLC